MSASESEVVKVSMNVVLNQEKTKVLLAEIGRDFADILSSFLTIPLGSVAKLFEKHYGAKVGSLNTLRDCLAELDDVHFWTKEGKDMLLNPTNIFADKCSKLKINLDDSQPIKFFSCDYCADAYKYVNVYYNNGRCKCGEPFNKGVALGNIHENGCASDGVFMAGEFILTDDMKMMPNAFFTHVQILNDFGITDVDGLERRTVHFGINEVRDLLKGMLFSRTPLTDIILKRQIPANMIVSKYEPTEQKETTSNKKMVVKAVFQKSTNKLLFVEAGDDFIEYLFSLFTIPLGKVSKLLLNNPPFECLHNLERSISRLGQECLKTRHMKSKLDQLYIPLEYLFKRQMILGFREDVIPLEFLCYLRGRRTSLLTDELKVAPLSVFSTVSMLNQARVAVSDVKEVELEIREDKALELLRASLISSTVFTDVLQRQRKQERDI